MNHPLAEATSDNGSAGAPWYGSIYFDLSMMTAIAPAENAAVIQRAILDIGHDLDHKTSHRAKPDVSAQRCMFAT